MTAEEGTQKAKEHVRPLLDKGRKTALFVGAMSKDTKPEEVESAFSSCGEVASCQLYYNRDTEESKGQARIEYTIPDSVQKAIDKFHLKEFKGKRIVCSEWHDDSDGRRIPGPSVFLAKLNPATTVDSIQAHFESIGVLIVDVTIFKNWEAGGGTKSKGLARVELGDEEDVRTAIGKLHDTELDDTNIVVMEYAKKSTASTDHTVFLSGVAYHTTEEGLRTHFSKAGEVLKVHVILDWGTGRSKGIGKVQFKDNDGYIKALEMNGEELDGRRIVVKKYLSANVATAAGSSSAARGESSAAYAWAQYAVFVDGLNVNTTKDQLQDHFACCGEILSCQIHSDRTTKGSRGSGKVAFATKEAKQRAIQELNTSELDNRTIVVREFSPNVGPDSGSAAVSPGLTVFVASLNAITTPETLKARFAECGAVVEVIISRVRESGQSRGFGRISFATEEARDRAIEMMNEAEVDGRRIIVRPFVPGAADRGGPGGGGSSSSRAPVDSDKRQMPADVDKTFSDTGFLVFVGSISPATTRDSLRAHFAQCGEVINCMRFVSKNGRTRGAGKVQFSTEEGMRAALATLNQSELDGHVISVREFAAAAPTPKPHAVFVGNLDYSTDAEKVKACFEAIGQVVGCKILVDESGRSKGMAKVEFATEELQCRAIEELSGTVVDGRTIGLQKFGGGAAVERPVQPDGRVGLGAAAPTPRESAIKGFPVFVSGMHFDTKAATLRSLFSTCGPLLDLRIITDRETQRSKGLAKVEFATQEAQARAIEELHRHIVDDREIAVRAFVDQADIEKRKANIFSVFVAGLSSSTTAKSLETHFRPIGDFLECRILLDRESGRSRGLGKIDFSTESAQLRAIEEMSHTELDGRMLQLRKFSQSPMDVPSMRAPLQSSELFPVFVAGLSLDTTSESLREHFERIGPIEECRVMTEKDGRSQGMGKVYFFTEKDQRKAVNTLADSELDGRLIVVHEFVAQPPPSSGGSKESKCAVFVSGLSPETTAERLRAHFADSGDIENCIVVADDVTGRPKGLGKVVFATQAEQRRAITKLAGSRLDGEVLVVREFVVDSQNPEAGPSGGAGCATAVFVTGLSKETTAAGLRRHFEASGVVGDVRIITDPETGISKGVAKVDFTSEADKSRAILELHGTVLDGRTIGVREYGIEPPRGSATTAWSVFVGGLSYETTTAGLRAHFEDAGEIRGARIMINVDTGRSRGVGKVDFETERGRDIAISEWHNTELDGRTISVKEFTVERPRPVGGTSSRMEGAARGAVDRSAVFVSGLSFETTTEGLRRYFEDVGRVRHALVLTSAETGRSRGVGKVVFASAEDATAAIQTLHNTALDGRTVTVREFVSAGAAGTTAHKVAEPVSSSSSPSHLSGGSSGVRGRVEETKTRGAATPLKPKVPAPPTRPAPSARKVDPDDGLVYRYDELEAKYQGRFSDTELLDFWKYDCLEVDDTTATLAASSSLATTALKGTPVSNLRPGVQQPGHAAEEQRMDPEDGQIYTFKEFRARAVEEGFGLEEVLEYWRDECLPIEEEAADPLAGGSPTASERRVDPEDDQVCTFTELEAKLRDHFDPEEILEYWQHDCLPVAPTPSRAGPPSSVAAAASAVAGDSTFTSAAPTEEERRIDPDDDKVCTFKELQEKYKDEFDADEILRFWQEDCIPLAAGLASGGNRPADAALASPAHGGAPPQPAAGPIADATALQEEVAPPETTTGESAARDAAAPADVERASTPSSRQGTVSLAATLGGSLTGMSIKDWVEAVDAPWLRLLPAHHQPSTGVRDVRSTIEEQFDSLGQILQLYLKQAPDGTNILDDGFFHDVGISKIGQRRVINKWVASNT